jgi:hypothetical protein
MKAIILKRLCACSIAVAILLFAIGTMLAQPRTHPKLNEDAFAFAVQLIKQGHFIADGKGAWSEHRPSADEENEFIRVHGFSEYAKWHLGIDDRYPEKTKGRYKFPYGDFKNVHRFGVLAVQTRAGEYRYSEIENAAAQLRAMIETTRNAAPSGE